MLLSRLCCLLLMLLLLFSHLQLISSKVPKAEYVPTIIRRDDPSIIPILYVSKSLLLWLRTGVIQRLFVSLVPVRVTPKH